jgi:hypothetical protein
MGWAARDGMGVKSSSSYYINNRQPKELELELVREVGPREQSGLIRLRPLRCVSTGPVVVRLAEMAINVNVNVNVGPN